jgi:hypothetical protein
VNNMSYGELLMAMTNIILNGQQYQFYNLCIFIL